MPKAETVKTSFTAGEVTPSILGRGDLRAYENGARKLRNVVVAPTGGVSRRPGLAYVDAARGAGRLVSFEFNTEQVYLLAFTDQHADVYRDGSKVADFETPWTSAQLGQIAWTQSADTLLVVHPEVEARKITRSSHTEWTIEAWSFVEESGRIQQPHHKFAKPSVTMTASAASGTVTLTASADVFQSGHANVRFRIGGKEVKIASVDSATTATAEVKEELGGTDATEDWEEQAFSGPRGWPVSVGFHQDRLVIGGSRDLPNRLWLSKSSDLWNFDLGTGLDDEAIEFALLSDQVNAIRAVFSGRHLQVLTSGTEWMVTGQPLTPGKIQLNRQTRVGSPVDRQVPPRDVDGATIYAGRAGDDLREFLYTDLEQAYISNDLAMLAKHLCQQPVDMDYDPKSRLLHVVMQDGTLGTVTNYRAEQVTAWSLQTTEGDFRSVAVVGDTVYFLIERAATFFIERFDGSLNTDCALVGDSETPKSVWSGLDHLEGKNAAIVADGAQAANAVVQEGEVTLAFPASRLEAGLAFAHEIEPLPPVVGPPGSRLVRLISVSFRIQETAALRVDSGRGPVPVPFRRLDHADVLDAAPVPFTGEVKLRALGWHRDPTAPLWRVVQQDPLPCTVLSVTTEIKVND
jgi:hypothetical protein